MSVSSNGNSSEFADYYRLDSVDSPLPTPRWNVATSKPDHLTEPFLRGPIPADWLRRMCDTKSSVACKVGLALWMQSGIKYNQRTIKFGSSVRQQFGISRPNAKRGLDKLIEAGLIKIVEQKPGNLPIVKIISSGGPSSEGSGK
jgi:hypothetical protein